MPKELDQTDKPPILHSWKNIYLLVFGFLVLQIVLFYLISLHYQ